MESNVIGYFPLRTIIQMCHVMTQRFVNNPVLDIVRVTPHYFFVLEQRLVLNRKTGICDKLYVPIASHAFAHQKHNLKVFFEELGSGWAWFTRVKGSVIYIFELGSTIWIGYVENERSIELC